MGENSIDEGGQGLWLTLNHFFGPKWHSILAINGTIFFWQVMLAFQLMLIKCTLVLEDQ